MKRPEEDDELLAALAGLPTYDMDASRASSILRGATGALLRPGRFVVATVFYTRYLEPLAAAVLSFALLGFTAANAAYVLQHGIGIWR